MAQRNADEIKLQNAILDFIKFQPRKGFAWPVDNRAQWDAKLHCFRKYTRHHRKGVPDICGIWCRRPLFIEVKTKTGVVSPDQKQFLSEAKQHGAIAFVCRDLNQAMAVLNGVSFSSSPPPSVPPTE